MTILKKILKKIKTKDFRIFLIVGLFSGILIGIFLNQLIMPGNKYKINGSKGLIFTNPALNYYELEEMLTSNKIINLSKEISEYAKQKKSIGELSFLSVYYRNLNNGGYFGINQNEEFSPASLMKLPILITYVKKSETIEGFLEHKITYMKPKDNINYKQNILSQKRLEEGKEYTIWEICEFMIKYSDNDASVFLERIISPEHLKKTFIDMGITFPERKNGQFDNNVKIIDYASFFRVLFNASYLNRDNSEKVLKLLSEVEFHEGINIGVPENLNVSHKFGERGIIGKDGKEEKQLHDCGIVYYPNHPYLICIMSRGYDRQNLKNAIADVSKIIYDKVEAQYGENPLDTSNDIRKNKETKEVTTGTITNK